MPVLTAIDVKEEFHQTSETLTIRLKPPHDLLQQIESCIQSNSLSLLINGEEVWRLELYGAVNSYDTAVKLQGRWIEVELQKQSPAFWPSLKKHSKTEQQPDKAVDKWSAEVKMELEPGVEISVSDKFKDEELIKPADKPKPINILEPPPNTNIEGPPEIEAPNDATTTTTTTTTTLKISQNNTTNNSTNGLADEEIKSKIPKLSEEVEEPPSLHLLAYNKSGMENTGNTCFLNCVLQCLANCIPLRNYFIAGEFFKEINPNNPLGYAGILAKQFQRLLGQIWVKGDPIINPIAIKHLLYEKTKAFSGYGQQDAHEFMNYFMDGIHEDLNRVINKPTTEQVISDGREDSIVAEEAWRVFKQRNDSFIVDNFHGQFKSTLVCPKCRNVSVTFDPFMTLSVPLPKKTRLFIVHMFWMDVSVKPRMIKLPLPTDANLELLKASLGRKIFLHMTTLRVFEAYRSKIQKNLQSNSVKINSINDSDVIAVCEVLSPAGVGEKVMEVPILQRTFSPKMPTQCAQCQRPESIIELKRCTQCMSVAYCGRNCQSQHWAQHRPYCKLINESSAIGMPFIVSLPHSKWTYRNLATAALKYASRSVRFELLPQNTGEESEDEDSRILSAFTMRPVNNFGSNVPKTLPLDSTNLDEIIVEKFDFLAIDWITDNKNSNYVKLTDFLVDYIEDESMAIQKIEEPKVTTLEHCVHAFSEPETLSEDDAWYCSICQEHREATKMMVIWRTPPLLIIQLKRFMFRNIEYKEHKLAKHIEYPISGLDLSKYTLGGGGGSVYDLYGVIHHKGLSAGGHYIAFANNSPGSQDGWICYNDKNATYMSVKDVVSNGAYVLLYKLREAKKTDC